MEIQKDAHLRIFKNFGVLVDSGRIDGDSVSSSDQVRFSGVGHCEIGIRMDVSDHEHS